MTFCCCSFLKPLYSGSEYKRSQADIKIIAYFVLLYKGGTKRNKKQKKNELWSNIL